MIRRSVDLASYPIIMSQDHSSDQQQPGALDERAHLRTDFRTRDLVNQAIAAVPALGVQQCAEYLSAMKVPPEVAIRALCSRRQRD